MLEQLARLDTQIFYIINQARHPWLDEGFLFLYTFHYLTLLFSVFLAVCLSFYLIRKKRAPLTKVCAVLLLMGAIVGVTEGSSYEAKKIFERSRPLNSLPLTYFLDDTVWNRTPANFTPNHSHNFSFYSGHATNSMALAVTVSAFMPPVAPLAYAAALGVGYSRVYVGKHFPLDVVAGWVTGFLYSTFAVYCYRRATSYGSKRK